MRLPFELKESRFEEEARVKFIFTSPELHQNIEISLDGENCSMDALFDAFQRFLGALGIALPEGIVVGLIEEDFEDEDNDEDGEEKE